MNPFEPTELAGPSSEELAKGWPIRLRVGYFFLVLWFAVSVVRLVLLIYASAAPEASYPAVSLRVLAALGVAVFLPPIGLSILVLRDDRVSKQHKGFASLLLILLGNQLVMTLAPWFYDLLT